MFCFVLAASSNGQINDQSGIVAHFASRSIPVEKVTLKDLSVVVRLNYHDSPGSDRNSTQGDVLSIFRKIAEEYPQMETILVEIWDAGEAIFDVGIGMKVALEYAQGRIGEEDVLSQMAVKERLSFGDILTSLLPDDPEPGRPAQIINPRAEDAEQPAPSSGKPDGTTDGETQPDPNALQIIPPVDTGQTNYLGAHFAQHQEEGIKLVGVVEDSPAQHAGLRAGDIILEVEQNSFHEKGSDPGRFVSIVSALPVDKPLRFHVQREAQRFDVWIKLKRVDQATAQSLIEKSRRGLTNEFEQGRQLMLSQDYAGAIQYFLKSLKPRPHDSHQALGICYYHTGRFKEAEKHIEEAYKLDKTNPLNAFYLAATLDQRNKTLPAVHFYEKYLSLNHGNAEMRDFASNRLKALKNRRGKPAGDALFQIINAILKEVK